MQNTRSASSLVRRALAFAHAALEDATPRYAIEAKRFAEEVLPRVSDIKPRAVALGEAHELFQLVGQLRAVMTLLERKLQMQESYSN